MKNILTLMIASILICSCGSNKPKKFTESWESLANHKAAPEWFADAKLGIYFHWGVYSVPAYANEWYPRSMHFRKGHVYKHHVKNYGEPTEFGYHDFVPMFKAEKFNAEEWVDLFHKAGAKFAGPVSEHHDGFSMWDSDVTPWNSKDMGPKKDITGLMKKAVEKRGMKFITTFHHARNLQRYADKPDEKKYFASHYPFIKGDPATSTDSKLKYLYGNMPEDQWNEEVWFGKLKEVIDKYQPDIIWFDSWLDQIPEEYRKKFSAYYLNEADKWGKEVVIVRKQDDLPLNYTVDDLEKSRKNRLEKNVWMTDETISKGSWCYTQNLRIKPTADVLHVLIDITSKNGVLLLNVSPMADGTIPQDQQNVLLTMGKWLKKYGEAIYGTRPWYTYGEGPTKEPDGHFKNRHKFAKIKYSSKDVRYTTKGNVIYANLLGDVVGDINLKAFSDKSQLKNREVKKVTILNTNTTPEWTLDTEGLHINPKSFTNGDMASVVKIELK